MTDNELLLAISGIMDKKLDAKLKPLEDVIYSIKKDMHSMKNEIHFMQGELQYMKSNIHSMKNEIQYLKLSQENVTLPQLDTYKRYRADKMESYSVDIELLKKVIAEHSEILQKIS